MNAIPEELSAGRRSDLRIAYIAPTLARGYYWQPIFREITRQIPNTVIFTSNWPGFLPGYEDKFNVQHLRGYKYFVSEVTSTGAEVGITWASPAILGRLMEFRPDVIFASAFNVWTIYALMYKAVTGCRVILGWEGNAPTTTYLNRPVRLKARRIMGRFVDAAYSNTQEGLEYLRNVIGLPEEKLYQHPFQVPEVNALRLGSEGAPLEFPHHPIFLFVGSVVKRKGWKFLLEATIRLKRTIPNPFSVVLVGPGEELDELRQVVSEHQLEDTVHVEGHVSYDILGKYFRACDVFVLPTLEDTWGMVVLEAMIFGKAVLCSKYAGSREMIQDGVNGFVFDPYDPDQLALNMQRFIEHPELIAEYGAKSSEIIAPFTPERTASIFAELAEKVVLSPPHRRARPVSTLTTVKEPKPSSPEQHIFVKTPSAGKLKVVTTSWDDGDRSDLKVADLLRARALPGTFYVPVSRDNDSLTSSDLRLLSSEGFEIGAHGYSQKFLWQLSPSELAAEIEPCKPTLEDTIGRKVRMFCYPRGRYDGGVIRALEAAGYQGARTVRMLSTSTKFHRFEMPTTVQIYPHPRMNYVRNVMRGRKFEGLTTCLAYSSKLTSWLDLGKKLFDSVMERGGIFHIYGHSWELEELNLWQELEQLLDYISRRQGVTYLSNGDLSQLISEQQTGTRL